MEKDQLTMRIVLLGGSAGSLEVVLEAFEGIPPNLPHPVVLVLHRKPSDDHLLEDLLTARSAIRVVHVEDKTQLRPGFLYIAPSDYHLLFEKNMVLALDLSAKVNYSRPSIDVSFESAANAFGNRVTAILLSGANSDGANGLKTIQNMGGTTVVQAPMTASIPAMPQSAIDIMAPDLIADEAQIIKVIESATINWTV